MQQEKIPDGRKKHARNKRSLFIAGTSLTSVGGIMIVIGIVLLARAVRMTSDSDVSSFVGAGVCLVIGFGLASFGSIILAISKRQEISRYMKNETVPVINEASQELKPAVKNFVSAAKEADDQTVICPNCQNPNSSTAKFCSQCGLPLSKVCPKCGKASSFDASFCASCGEKLK